MRVLLTSMALAFAGTAANAAAVQPAAPEQFTVAVPYGDLNLSSPEGIAALRGRVQAKAAQACDVTPITLGQAIAVRKCRMNFVRSAERNLELATAPAGGTILLAAR